MRATMTGSWAGAMGQTQFMPSSYLTYAVDFDNDGRRDIWKSTPDALASIANYMKGYGWNGDETWGREVRVSAAAPDRSREDPQANRWVLCDPQHDRAPAARRMARARRPTARRRATAKGRRPRRAR